MRGEGGRECRVETRSGENTPRARERGRGVTCGVGCGGEKGKGEARDMGDFAVWRACWLGRGVSSRRALAGGREGGKGASSAELFLYVPEGVGENKTLGRRAGGRLAGICMGYNVNKCRAVTDEPI